MFLGKKPFSCKECTFRTAYKDSLELHLNNVHGHGPRKLRTRQQMKDEELSASDITTMEGTMGDAMAEMMLKHDGQVTVQDAEGGMSVITVGEVGETVIVGDVIHTVDAKDVQGVVEQITGTASVHQGSHHVQGNIITTASGTQVIVGGPHQDGQEETVTATEDLMALVGIGAANVVQQE